MPSLGRYAAPALGVLGAAYPAPRGGLGFDMSALPGLSSCTRRGVNKNSCPFPRLTPKRGARTWGTRPPGVDVRTTWEDLIQIDAQSSQIQVS
jgi:hypothetical protein